MDETTGGCAWPPPPTPEDAEAVGTKRRSDPVAALGHLVALLPPASFLFMLAWFRLCVYDNDENVIGPGWVVRLGGEGVAHWPIPACLAAGLLCFVVGILRRRGVTMGEGLWAFLAGFVLDALYKIATF